MRATLNLVLALVRMGRIKKYVYSRQVFKIHTFDVWPAGSTV